jgi:phosphatidate cytidylyltransferase
LVCSVAAVFSRHATRPVDALSSTFLGILLIPFAFAHLLLLVQAFPDSLEGLYLGLWTIAVAKFSDAGALLAGMAFGKRKMAPHISPAKTWEGAAGGILFGTAVGVTIVGLFKNFFPADLTLLYAALAAFPITIAAIFSDLLESSLKREAGVKDSGKTIPGIGGIFDLTDSLILTSPMAYYLFLPLTP